MLHRALPTLVFPISALNLLVPWILLDIALEDPRATGLVQVGRFQDMGRIDPVVRSSSHYFGVLALSCVCRGCLCHSPTMLLVVLAELIFIDGDLGWSARRSGAMEHKGFADIAICGGENAGQDSLAGHDGGYTSFPGIIYAASVLWTSVVSGRLEGRNTRDTP